MNATLATLPVRSWRPNHRDNLVCRVPRRVEPGTEVLAVDDATGRDVVAYVIRSQRQHHCDPSERFLIEVVPIPDISDVWELAYGLRAPHVDGGAG